MADARDLLSFPTRRSSDLVGRAVVDRVARCAPRAEQLPLRTLPGPDGGDVLVALAVDLGGSHHHVPLAPGDDVEDAAERDPALHDLLLRVDRRHAGEPE